MKKESLAKVSDVVTITSGIPLLVWWASMVVPMPAPVSETLLLDMVRHPAWIPLNAVGSFATMLLPLALVGRAKARRSEVVVYPVRSVEAAGVDTV